MTHDPPPTTIDAVAEKHSEGSPNYVGVFLALFVLTIAEVGIVYMPLVKVQQVFLLLATAVSKALLVALYYMHLKFERFVPTIFIALVPLLLTLQAVILVLLGISWAYR